MNLGILQVNTDYFQILNSGTTYFSETSLELSMREIDNLTIKFGYLVHTYKMAIINLKKVKSSKLMKFTYPFNCGHESTIYPNPKKNRILHYHKYKISADCNFLLDYSDYYKVYFHENILVRYPKGGYSDSPDLFLEKIEGYLLLLIKTFFKFKLGASIYLLNRISKDYLRRALSIISIN